MALTQLGFTLEIVDDNNNNVTEVMVNDNNNAIDLNQRPSTAGHLQSQFTQVMANDNNNAIDLNQRSSIASHLQSQITLPDQHPVSENPLADKGNNSKLLIVGLMMKLNTC